LFYLFSPLKCLTFAHASVEALFWCICEEKFLQKNKLQDIPLGQFNFTHLKSANMLTWFQLYGFTLKNALEVATAGVEKISIEIINLF
jgi:hypothetical protein